MKQLAAAVVMLMALCAGAVAGPLEDGYAAWQRGDYATAMRFWRPLAEQGGAGAQYNLGLMYETGEGVPQDYVEAVRWYRLAAEQGHTGAQNNLGVMYANGQGVPQDYVEAHMWLNLAAAQGHEAAAKNRDIATSLMTREQLAEAQRMARDWYAAHGN